MRSVGVHDFYRLLTSIVVAVTAHGQHPLSLAPDFARASGADDRSLSSVQNTPRLKILPFLDDLASPLLVPRDLPASAQEGIAEGIAAAESGIATGIAAINGYTKRQIPDSAKAAIEQAEETASQAIAGGIDSANAGLSSGLASAEQGIATAEQAASHYG
ncbi:MAG: hypothetical protein Q9163_002243 [Psora crenata]